MKNLEKLTNIIEAILLVSGQKVAISDIAEKLEVKEKNVLDCYEILKEKYSGSNGIHILIFNNKLQFCSNPDYVADVQSVLNPIKERELSRTLLEVAAIIAYKQPVTRIDLEEMRGNSEYAVQKLLELGMIEPVGRKDAVGRPTLFGTTDEFLKRFQIASLDELPDYDELMQKITLLHGNQSEDNYLYHREEYKPIDQVAVTEDENTEVNKTDTEQTYDIEKDSETIEEKVTKKTKKKKKPVDDDSDDGFELPPLDKEELPDFLKGEDVNKINND